jgi:hypothetical protein
LKAGKTPVFGEAVVRDEHRRVVATGYATYIYLEENTANWSV